MLSYTLLLNSNSSVSSDPPPPCYDDDNYEHPCTEDDPIALYWFAGTMGLGALIGASVGIYYLYKNYCTGVVGTLENPLLNNEV